MKRLIFKLLLFLVLGAIVNVAVAWGCSLRVRPNCFGSLSSTKMSEFTDDVAVGTSEWFVGFGYHGFGVAETRIGRHLGGDITIPGTGDFVILKQAGWPALALAGSCSEWKNYDGAIKVPEAWQQSVSFWTREPRFIPCKPIWPGFAINTALYGAGISVLILIP